MTRSEARQYIEEACCEKDRARRTDQVFAILYVTDDIRSIRQHARKHLDQVRVGEWYIVPNGHVAYVKINPQGSGLNEKHQYSVTLNGTLVSYHCYHKVIPITIKELHMLIDYNKERLHGSVCRCCGRER